MNARQLDFYRALQSRVLPELRIVQRGDKRLLEETGEIVLEGTPKEAAKIIGLPVREIYRLCEDGDLRHRVPKAGIARNKGRVDALGRKIGFAIVVDLKHAFEIRFGEETARAAFDDFGLN